MRNEIAFPILVTLFTLMDTIVLNIAFFGATTAMTPAASFVKYLVSDIPLGAALFAHGIPRMLGRRLNGGCPLGCATFDLTSEDSNFPLFLAALCAVSWLVGSLAVWVRCFLYSYGLVVFATLAVLVFAGWRTALQIAHLHREYTMAQARLQTLPMRRVPVEV